MINTKQLRCLVGCLGMALPIIVIALSVFFGYGIPDSISATYFIEPCITPFMIILGLASFLLCTYKGYTIFDNFLNTLAGICGLCICLFPCAAQEGNLGTFQVPAPTSDIIHMISAIGFFGILAFNSLFQFTKSSGALTENKKKRNVIYRICGLGMVCIFIPMIFIQFGLLNIPHGILWIELIALQFFGISWLTKADCVPFLFPDK